MQHIPYTYLLYCKPIKKYYYGVRYSKKCNPKDLWQSYFSSSRIIHYLIEVYGKDAFYYEVRKIFPGDPNAALKWEQKVLRRLNVNHKIKWLNQGLTGNVLALYNEGQEPWNKGVPSKQKGKVFFNNGKIQKLFFPNECPVGWVKGRLNKAWNAGLDKTDDRMYNNAIKAAASRKGLPSKLKGRSYEEIHGKERAATLRENLSVKYKNKTYEEIHGEERATMIKLKQSLSRRKEIRYGKSLWNECAGY